MNDNSDSDVKCRRKVIDIGDSKGITLPDWWIKAQKMIHGHFPDYVILHVNKDIVIRIPEDENHQEKTEEVENVL